MVKGRGSKATRPTRQAAPPSRRPVPEDEDDSSSDAGAGLHAKDPYADDSEDDDEAVFDLAGSDGSSDSEGSGGSDDDEESEFESETEIDRLVNNLPSSMKQRILRGKDDAEDSLSDGSDGSDDESQEGWGKKKKTYWSGDTADLEIGQDVQDAEDEEEAAMELERARSSGLDVSDYFEGMEAPAVEAAGRGKAAKSKAKGDSYRPDKLQKALEVAAGVADSVSYKRSVEVENIPRDVNALSKEQRLALLAVDTPELPGLAEELSERISELNQKINPVRALVKQVQSSHGDEACADEIVQYLEVKQQMLLSYCTNLTFYMLLKSQGRSVRSHPVMRQLLELRYAMEKLRPLDGKLKYQIDRLVKLAADGEGLDEAMSAVSRNRPNPFNLSARDGEDSSADEDADAGNRFGSREVRDDGIYRPPRMQAAMYTENEKQLDKTKEKLKTKRQKLKNSEIMESLREEFGVAPELTSSAGTGLETADTRALKEEEEERRHFEEERFVRLTMSRKDKKDIKKRERESTQALNNIADIGDIGEFEELNNLSEKYQEKSAAVDGFRSRDTGAPSVRKAMSERDSASALQRAVSAFAFGGADAGKRAAGDGDDVEDVLGEYAASRKKARYAPPSDDEDDDLGGGDYGGGGMEDDNDYDDDSHDMNEFDQMLADGDQSSGRSRRPAPSDFDEEDNMLEEFASKKKDFMKKKKDFYTAPVRVGGREEVVEEGHKRGVSYEIMANKGLMPHRKKANRNPRVKKREMYAKAVVARKGQVREVISGAAGAYGGEKTGIKANVARSRKINT